MLKEDLNFYIFNWLFLPWLTDSLSLTSYIRIFTHIQIPVIFKQLLERISV